MAKHCALPGDVRGHAVLLHLWLRSATFLADEPQGDARVRVLVKGFAFLEDTALFTAGKPYAQISHAREASQAFSYRFTLRSVANNSVVQMQADKPVHSTAPIPLLAAMHLTAREAAWQELEVRVHGFHYVCRLQLAPPQPAPPDLADAMAAAAPSLGLSPPQAHPPGEDADHALDTAGGEAAGAEHERVVQERGTAHGTPRGRQHLAVIRRAPLQDTPNAAQGTDAQRARPSSARHVQLDGGERMAPGRGPAIATLGGAHASTVYGASRPGEAGGEQGSHHAGNTQRRVAAEPATNPTFALRATGQPDTCCPVFLMTPFHHMPAAEAVQLLLLHMAWHARLGVCAYILYVTEQLGLLLEDARIQALVQERRLYLVVWDDMPVHEHAMADRNLWDTYALQAIQYSHALLGLWGQDVVVMVADVDEWLLTTMRRSALQVWSECPPQKGKKRPKGHSLAGLAIRRADAVCTALLPACDAPASGSGDPGGETQPGAGAEPELDAGKPAAEAEAGEEQVQQQPQPQPQPGVHAGKATGGVTFGEPEVWQPQMAAWQVFKWRGAAPGPASRGLADTGATPGPASHTARSAVTAAWAAGRRSADTAHSAAAVADAARRAGQHIGGMPGEAVLGGVRPARRRAAGQAAALRHPLELYSLAGHISLTSQAGQKGVADPGTTAVYMVHQLVAAREHGVLQVDTGCALWLHLSNLHRWRSEDSSVGAGPATSSIPRKTRAPAQDTDKADEVDWWWPLESM